MYMIYLQYMTAIKNAYAGREEAAQHAIAARQFRKWLETLEIESDLRNALVEPIQVLEEAFDDLAGSMQ